MTSPTVIDSQGLGPRPAGGTISPRSQGQTALRVLGMLLLVSSVVILISPRKIVSVSGGGLRFHAFTNQQCGVPLQALFGAPGYGCTQAAYTQAAESAVLAVLGFGILAFSGIKRRLRYLGLVALALSAFPMLLSSNEFQPVMSRTGDFAEICGSPVGDLARRGDTEVTFKGGTSPAAPECGDRALSRLYMTLAIAAFGGLVLVVDAIRRRNDPTVRA